MKKWIARLTAVLTAGMCLCTGLSLPASATDAATLQQYETEVLIQVNRERAAYGLDPLYTAASIQLAAERRAAECITSFSHTRPDGTSCFSILDDYNLSWSYVGENIAMGYSTPQAVVNGWMNSAGHRANILSENFQYLGVGAAENGVLCWSQMFMSSPKLSGAYIPTKQGVTGDADYDGEVGINDAYLTLRAYSVVSAGASLPMNDLQKSNCDIDHDNTISLQDALRILTYYSYTSAGKTISWNSIS